MPKGIFDTAPVIAEMGIDIIVIGAGLSGLASALALCKAGHNVTIIDKRDVSQPWKGAGGCRIPPNLVKIIRRWGLGEEFAKKALPLESLHMLRFETGEFLGQHEWAEEMLREAEGDYELIEYQDLWNIFYKGAQDYGATFMMNTTVTSVDPHALEVTLADGRILAADLFIGADGPQGLTRKLLSDDIEQTPSDGCVMYEAMIPADRVRDVPELKSLGLGQKDINKIMLFLGEGLCMHLFPVSGRDAFAMQLCVGPDMIPAGEPEGSWGDAPSVRIADKLPKNVEPRIKKLAEYAEPAVRVRSENTRLSTWVHSTQRLIVIGDAAHPFPPGAQQGSALAVEDAAVLGKLFTYLKVDDQIGNFLWAVQELRQDRCEKCLQEEYDLYVFLTLRQGEMQEVRDAEMRLKHESGRTDLRQGEDVAAKQWEELRTVYAYDCEDEADNWWIEWGLLRERARERNEFYNTTPIRQPVIQQSVRSV
ncbi:hypothetical protein QCA50_018464 [Cerrena zonata]|uniref:FAD-binding domain-containing protein n=1 Tax=Cerrena zonata TaxID=2478898 RepID=A0AAW0FEJ9_9APHY